MGSLARVLIFVFCAPALACEYPDEGNMPLRRAAAKVRYLPETEAWADGGKIGTYPIFPVSIS